MRKEISVVVPAYNEAGNLEVLTRELASVLSGYNYEIIFVNDGSKDDSLEVMKALHQKFFFVHFVSLSRNFGHQRALRCGISFATGDAVITMDADLQHPPALIPELIRLWKEGNDIVLTERKTQQDIGWSKKLFSSLFYWFINLISDTSFSPGAADFRLLDKKVVQIINSSPEADLFLRGFVDWVGFKKTAVAYDAGLRFSGSSQYSWKKMLSLALSGITSFSIKPLRLSSIIGGIISALSFFYAVYAICIYSFTDKAITGWTSLLVSMLFLGGLQLLMIGILGEYLGRLFIQSKGRPEFIVSESSF